MADDLGSVALAALDDVLRQRPRADPVAFSQATRGVAALRDQVATEPPGPGRRGRLNHVNAVLAMVLAGHFPSGPVPWHEIEAARGWLADVVRPA